jgi:hypothetical protein
MAFQGAAGTSTRPIDPSRDHFDLAADLSVSALVQSAPGVFTTYPGTAGPDGVYAIPGVPCGPYYLVERGANDTASFSVTDERIVDRPIWALGRASATPLGSSAMLSFDLTGLPPWRHDDVIQIATPFTFLYGSPLSPPPQIGDTAVHDLQFPIGVGIDPSEGDRVDLWVSSATTTQDGQPYEFTSKVFRAPPFGLATGQATRFSGAFADPFSTRTIDVDFRPSEFVESFAGANPGGEITEFYIEVAVLPDTASHWPRADLIELPPDSLELGEYKAPFPDVLAPLPLVIPDRGQKLVACALASGAWYSGIAESGVAFDCLVRVPLTDEGTGTLSLRPTLGPVQNIRIDGIDATQSLRGVGSTPTLSWDPPAQGRAQSYKVWVFTLERDPTYSYGFSVSTPGPPLTLPPGQIQRPFAFVIIAYSGDPSALDTSQSWASSAPMIP